MNKPCEKMKDKITDYVLGILDKKEIVNLKKHITQCASCKEHLESLQNEREVLLQFCNKFDNEMNAREKNVIAALEKVSNKESTKTTMFYSKVFRFAAAAAIIAVVLIGLNKFGGSTVAWADVVDKFKSVTFFNATFYIKDNVSDDPKQIDIWMGHGGRARVKVREQMLFAKNGKIISGFNYIKKEKIDIDKYDSQAWSIINMLGQSESFSLDTVVQTMSNGVLKDVTPSVNPDAVISEDIVVFDLTSKSFSEWLRIWALRESKLPIRILALNPENGQSQEVVLTYTKEQSESFFNPEEYQKILTNSRSFSGDNSVNLAYSLLKDSGGRNYAPEKSLEKIVNYHMPEVERIGITKHGAVWVVASNSQNTGRDDRTFYGFSKVTDNLNRNYSRFESTWRIDNVSVQVFVPDGFPFDVNIPNKIILHCNSEVHHPGDTEDDIGSVDFTEWEPNSIWPQERLKQTEADIMLSKAGGYVRSKKYDECMKVINLVKELEPGTKNEHEIGRINLAMLISQSKFDEADKLAEKLWSEEIEIFKKEKANASLQPFIDYIVAIAGNGRIDRAAQLFKEIRTTEPDLSKYNPNVRKEILAQFKTKSQSLLGYGFTQGLFFNANLTLEQVNQILGFNVLDNDETKWYVSPKYRMANDPKAIAEANARNKQLNELVEYYKAHPLEEGQMDIRKGQETGNGYSIGSIQGLDGYKIWRIGSNVDFFAKSYPEVSSSGRMRYEGDFSNIYLQYDIVGRGNIPTQKYVAEALSKVGIEVVESEDTCAVWIAEYNGQKLKNPHSIKIPYPNAPAGIPGSLAYSGPPIKMKYLLYILAQQQDIVIEDKTGIEEKTELTWEVPNFKTQVGADLAKEWFKDNFGITFKVEPRRMKVWVVRKKAQ